MKRYTRRSFPPYRHRPGETPHPELDPKGHLHGVESEPPERFDPGRWHECEDYLWGVDLFNHRYFWEAHEAWEGLWNTVRGQKAGLFLRGLIQIAAALLKREMGSEKGMRSLAEKGLAKVRQAEGVYCGIEIDPWSREIEKTIDTGTGDWRIVLIKM